MTAPEVGEIDPSQHLSFADITVDNVENPAVCGSADQAVQDGLIKIGLVHCLEQDRVASLPGCNIAG